MIVLDASVLANAFTDDGPIGVAARTELARDVHWAAPEHLVVEVFSAIRGRWLGRKISERRARDALTALASSTVDLMTTRHLVGRMWDLRNNASGSDAAYIAVAEALDCALVTADGRLSRVSNLRCEVRVAVPTP